MIAYTCFLYSYFFSVSSQADNNNFSGSSIPTLYYNMSGLFKLWALYVLSLLYMSKYCVVIEFLYCLAHAKMQRLRIIFLVTSGVFETAVCRVLFLIWVPYLNWTICEYSKNHAESTTILILQSIYLNIIINLSLIATSNMALNAPYFWQLLCG